MTMKKERRYPAKLGCAIGNRVIIHKKDRMIEPRNVALAATFIKVALFNGAK